MIFSFPRSLASWQGDLAPADEIANRALSRAEPRAKPTATMLLAMVRANLGAVKEVFVPLQPLLESLNSIDPLGEHSFVLSETAHCSPGSSSGRMPAECSTASSPRREPQVPGRADDCCWLLDERGIALRQHPADRLDPEPRHHRSCRDDARRSISRAWRCGQGKNFRCSLRISQITAGLTIRYQSVLDCSDNNVLVTLLGGCDDAWLDPARVRRCGRF